VQQDVVILLAEDDEGHAGLIKRNLIRTGIINEMMFFKDGQEILDFLFKTGDGPQRKSGESFVLLLDIRMPKVDGVEVLKQVKADPKLCSLPVIIITTTDDPREVERCHALGCNSYITKPVAYDEFVNAVRQLGLFLSVVQVPKIDGEESV
jgi:CheY-like chemotaxis protein